MDKQKLNITKNKTIKFEFQDQEIKLDTFISPVDQAIIIRDYIKILFKDDNITDNYLSAEWNMTLDIINKYTNIPILEESLEEKNINISLETLIVSGLWNEIKSKIINYEDLLNDLDIVVEQIQNKNALEKSVGSVINNVAVQAQLLFDRISKIDLSQEGVKSLLAEFQKQTATLDSKVVVHPKAPQPRKKKGINSNGTPS